MTERDKAGNTPAALVLCVCDPTLVRMYATDHGGRVHEVGALAVKSPPDPLRLATMAAELVGFLGLDGPERNRADFREMRNRVSRIVAALSAAKQPMTARELAVAADLPAPRRHDVYRLLRRMVAEGRVRRVGDRPPYTFEAVDGDVRRAVTRPRGRLARRG